VASETRQKVYDYLIKYIEEYCYAPSLREICVGVGLKSTSSVYEHLSKLEEEGKIKMRGNSPRAIKVIGYGYVKLDEIACDEDEQTEIDEEEGGEE
jgi:SOS-response transcriptional repressor LexA